MRKIWLDDMREAPDDFYWVKDYGEAVAAFKKAPVDIASLDHDLMYLSDYGFYGGKSYTWLEKNGCDFVQWLVDNPEHWPTYSLAMHTDYAVGRQNMMKLIEDHGPYNHKEPYEVKYGNYGAHAWGFIYYKEDPNASKEEGSESS